NAKSINQV
ncbi:unnamed protein product, partial [Allacma fusca]